jgi:hypothetical protein
MRHVVDSNYLRSPALEAHLSASVSHRVVVTDQTRGEMLKRNAALTVSQSLQILSRFPTQVEILRNADQFYGHRITSAKRARALICKRQTRDFADFSKAACHLTPAFIAEMERSEPEAAAYIAKLERDTFTIRETFKLINREFTASELEELRRREPLSRGAQRTLLDVMFGISRGLFRDVGWPEQYVPRSHLEAMHTFVFRYAMCMTLLYTRWVAAGQQMKTSASRFANDVIDMNTAAMGTFFSGVLSRDEKLIAVHREARYLLRIAGVFVG